MNKVLEKLLEFQEERDWKQYNTPQNIAKSMVLEAAEVLEIFQWKTNSDLSPEEMEHLSEELADVYNWIVLLSHDLGIDIEEVALKKIKDNAKKYPAELVKGSSKKYTEL